MMPASDETTIFPEALASRIQALTEHYPEPAAALIPALHLVQERFGYISDPSIDNLGQILGIAPAEILGTLTFYTMFRREPSGRFHISVCKNISCTLMESRKILAHLEEKLGIKVGETTDDGLFTLEGAECLGACSEAPVMEVDGNYFFRLTPDKVDALLEDFRRQAGSPTAD